MEQRLSWTKKNNILWSENDQIVAFMNSSYGHKYLIKPSFAGKTYADFSRVSSTNGDDIISAGMELDHIVAYYPYAEGVECVKSDDGYTLDVILPAEQTYVENSFGNGIFPMVAVSKDNDITFKNVCGGIKLQLIGTQKVTSITIQGKNDEKLCGEATVTAYTDGETKPVIEMAEDASVSVTLNCGTEGVQLNEDSATEFIITLPPVVFTEGFTIKVTDNENNTHIVETDEENTVLRSSLLVMPAVKIEDSERLENVKFSILISSDNDTKSASYTEYVDVVYYEIWDSDWANKIYPDVEGELAKEIVVDGSATVNLSLDSRKTYNIIFWAQNEECGAYDVSDLKKVKVDYSAMSASQNMDKFDAFYAVNCFTVYGSMEEIIHLKRPLALLYLGDEGSDVESPQITGMSLSISNLATVFNTLQACGEVASEEQVTFVVDEQDSFANGLNYKSYVFVPESSSLVNLEACFEIDGQQDPLRIELNNIPLRQNMRTDVLIEWPVSRLSFFVIVQSIDDIVSTPFGVN